MFKTQSVTSFNILGISVFGYPYTAISGFYGHLVIGYKGCLISGYTCFFLTIGSLNTLVAISVYRYIILCKPEYSRCQNCPNNIMILDYQLLVCFQDVFISRIDQWHYSVKSFCMFVH